MVEPTLLPLHTSGLPLAKKADLAYAVTPDHTDVNGVYDSFAAKHPGMTVSHLQDAYTRSLVIDYAVEVKEPSGDQSQASMQLALFHAALLRKFESLVAMSGQSTSRDRFPPLLGRTVVGHDWRSYITSMAEDDSIVSPG